MNKTTMRTLLWSAMLPVIATATPAWSQQATQPSETEARSGVDEIIVTARRKEESQQTTPVAVTALSAEMLERRQVTDIGALQYTAPSFTVAPATGDTSAANISVRGQTQSDNLIALDPAVGIYLDGVYVARSTGALFNLVDMQRVEVLRGPQGTLYGRNTTGGAVNLIANRPDDKLGGSISGRIGDFDLREVTAVGNLPLGDQAGLRIAYQHSEHSGYGTNAFRRTDLADDNTDFVRATFTLAPTGSGFDFTLMGDYTDRENSGQLTRLLAARPTVFAGATPIAGVASLVPTVCAGPAGVLCALSVPGDTLQNYIGGDFYTNRTDRTPQFNRLEAGGVSATATQDFGAFSARLIGSWRFTRSDASRDLDGTPYTLLASGGQVDQEQTTLEFQVFGDAFGDKLNWIAGVYQFAEDGFDNSQSFNLVPLRTTRNDISGYGDNSSLAYFGQATLNLSDKLRVTGGVRYTEDDRLLRASNVVINPSTGAVTACNFPAGSIDAGTTCTSTRQATFDYVSYLASVDYQLSDNAFVYLKTSRASRAGGFNVRGIEGSSLSPFDPEQVTDFEAGAKLDLLDRRLRINGAIYYSDYKDIQRNLVTVTSNGQLVAFVQNAAEAHITGGELEVTLVPVDNLRLSTVVGVLEPKYDNFRDPITGVDRSNEPFPRTPKTTVGASAEYTFETAMGDLIGHVDYSWRSEAFFNTTSISRQDAYGLVNATLTFDAEKFKIGLFGRNLADEQYNALRLDTTTTPLGLAVGFPGEPRTYGVTLGYNF